MSYKNPQAILRLLSFILWLIIVGGLSYRVYALQIKVRNLEQSKTAIPGLVDYLSSSADAQAMELEALTAANKTYRAILKRQRINLKECMAKLPQHEVDDFYSRHREELRLEMLK